MIRLIRHIGLAFAVLMLGSGLWLTHFIWPQPEYTDMGPCSAEQIDKTYAAITGMNGWSRATTSRVFTEGQQRNPHGYSLNARISEAVNYHYYKSLARRHTAAFHCNNAYVNLENEPPLTTLPQVVERLRPVANEDKEGWLLAVCLSIGPGYSPVYPNGFTIDERLKPFCDQRKVAWSKRL